MTDDIILEASHVSMIYGHNKARAAQLMEAGGEKTSVFQETGATVALWDVNFKVRRGEIFVIIGLSGSGKSTIVRCFNQLLKPTGGYAAYEGQHIDAMSKQELLEFRRSKISMVFQNFGLFTHRTVLENVVYGLEVRGVPRQERRDKAVEVIKLVGLEGWEDRPITSLSGGMKQRVGIARALANDPEVLLMDEPFSALDPLVRQDMQFELLQIQRKLGKTILFITHDINEAFKLGDTVAIMRDGKIVQIDTPAGMSMAPADDYVRAFIESADKANVLSVSASWPPPPVLSGRGMTRPSPCGKWAGSTCPPLMQWTTICGFWGWCRWMPPSSAGGRSGLWPRPFSGSASPPPPMCRCGTSCPSPPRPAIPSPWWGMTGSCWALSAGLRYCPQ